MKTQYYKNKKYDKNILSWHNIDEFVNNPNIDTKLSESIYNNIKSMIEAYAVNKFGYKALNIIDDVISDGFIILFSEYPKIKSQLSKNNFHFTTYFNKLIFHVAYKIQYNNHKTNITGRHYGKREKIYNLYSDDYIRPEKEAYEIIDELKYYITNNIKYNDIEKSVGCRMLEGLIYNGDLPQHTAIAIRNKIKKDLRREYGEQIKEFLTIIESDPTRKVYKITARSKYLQKHKALDNINNE